MTPSLVIIVPVRVYPGNCSTNLFGRRQNSQIATCILCLAKHSTMSDTTKLKGTKEHLEEFEKRKHKKYGDRPPAASIVRMELVTPTTSISTETLRNYMFLVMRLISKPYYYYVRGSGY